MKIWCQHCKGTGDKHGCKVTIACPHCTNGFIEQGCGNCEYKDGEIGKEFNMEDEKTGEKVNTIQYHCSFFEQYFPDGITCENWRHNEINNTQY